MQVRILGAHQVESRDTRLTSILIDGRLALDAGSLGRSLTLEEQGRIEAVALTHQHYDHLRDLPTLGLATDDGGPTVTVFGLPETLGELHTRMMDGTLYRDFTQHLSPQGPRYRLHPVTPYQEVSTGAHTLLPLPVPHGPPAVAYQVTDSQGHSFLFGGDCGPGVRQIWPHVRPLLMILEVTYANRLEDPERLRSHLTPAALERELRAYQELHGVLPQVIATHFNPWHETEIKEELGAVSQALGAEIRMAEDGLTLEV